MQNLTTPIALLGGTFNPIHWGHLLPTKAVMAQTQITELQLIPCHKPPHKESPGINSEQRAQMAKLACIAMDKEHQCQMSVNPLELKRQKPSYTVDTLAEIKQNHPNRPLCFLMGMDSLLNFNKWHQWQDIIQLCHLIVSPRPGYQLNHNSQIYPLIHQRLTKDYQVLHQNLAGQIYLATIEPIDLSSTQIRENIQQDIISSKQMPQQVCDYIKSHKLYR